MLGPKQYPGLSSLLIYVHYTRVLWNIVDVRIERL